MNDHTRKQAPEAAERQVKEGRERVERKKNMTEPMSEERLAEIEHEIALCDAYDPSEGERAISHAEELIAEVRRLRQKVREVGGNPDE